MTETLTSSIIDFVVDLAEFDEALHLLHGLVLSNHSSIVKAEYLALLNSISYIRVQDHSQTAASAAPPSLSVETDKISASLLHREEKLQQLFSACLDGEVPLSVIVELFDGPDDETMTSSLRIVLSTLTRDPDNHWKLLRCLIGVAEQSNGQHSQALVLDCFMDCLQTRPCWRDDVDKDMCTRMQSLGLRLAGQSSSPRLAHAEIRLSGCVMALELRECGNQPSRAIVDRFNHWGHMLMDACHKSQVINILITKTRQNLTRLEFRSAICSGTSSVAVL